MDKELLITIQEQVKPRPEVESAEGACNEVFFLGGLVVVLFDRLDIQLGNVELVEMART